MIYTTLSTATASRIRRLLRPSVSLHFGIPMQVRDDSERPHLVHNIGICKSFTEGGASQLVQEEKRLLFQCTISREPFEKTTSSLGPNYTCTLGTSSNQEKQKTDTLTQGLFDHHDLLTRELGSARSVA
jgi:hypothetical protein